MTAWGIFLKTKLIVLSWLLLAPSQVWGYGALRGAMASEKPTEQMLTLTPSSFSCGAEGGKKTVAIEGVQRWEAESRAYWISMNGWINMGGTPRFSGQGSGEIEVWVAPQDSAEQRTGTIEVRSGSIVGIISIAQVGTTASLTLLPESLRVGPVGGTERVAIACNLSWTATSDASWLSIQGVAAGDRDGAINIRIAAHTGTVARTGVITVRAGALSRMLSVLQSGLTILGAPKRESISLHPNPATDLMRLAGLPPADPTAQYTYAVYALSGQRLVRGPLPTDGLIKTKELLPGQYIFVLRNGSGRDIFRTQLLFQR